MATALSAQGDIVSTGAIVGRSLTLQTACITDAMIQSGANVQASKLEGEYHLDHYQTTGTAIVAATQDLKIVRGATGTLLSIEAAITGAIATGADRTVTVDLHKSTAAGAFASVLSATIGFTNASTLRTAVAGTISSTSLVDGDILRVVVTVAGAAGNQAQGLVVSVHMRELP